MSWNFRRRTRRREHAEEIVNQALGTSVLYADLRLILGPLADDLDESDKLSASRLLDMALYCAPVLHGLEEIRQHLLLLGCWPGLDPDMAGIFRQAAGHLYDGIQSCIFSPGERVMDQSRFLMEVEFLLYDFTARPGSLEVWRTAEPFKRNQQFGFGKLRGRREKDLGFEHGTVLPDRDEYMVHSSQVHPRPASELNPGEETPAHRRYYLMSDLADLFAHGRRVLEASAPVLRAFVNDSDAPDADANVDVDVEIGRPVETEVIQRALEFVNAWASGFETVPRPTSIPVKGIDWQAAQSRTSTQPVGRESELADPISRDMCSSLRSQGCRSVAGRDLTLRCVTSPVRRSADDSRSPRVRRGAVLVGPEPQLTGLSEEFPLGFLPLRVKESHVPTTTSSGRSVLGTLSI